MLLSLDLSIDKTWGVVVVVVVVVVVAETWWVDVLLPASPMLRYHHPINPMLRPSIIHACMTLMDGVVDWHTRTHTSAFFPSQIVRVSNTPPHDHRHRHHRITPGGSCRATQKTTTTTTTRLAAGQHRGGSGSQKRRPR